MKRNSIISAPLKRSILCFSMCVFALGSYSCSDDYNGTTDDSKDRASLEEWQKYINSDILSLQVLIEAIEEKDYVTGVTPHPDGTDYMISFRKGENITIRQGKKGEDSATPFICVKQDTDGKYYWTIDGEWLFDGENKIPVALDKDAQGDKAADATAPQVRINLDSDE